MIYLLDTNACIRFLQGRTAQLLERFAAVSAAEKHLCSVVIGELYYGAFKSEWRTGNLEKLDGFIGRFALLPFDVNAARHFGEIRAHLARQGTPIGPYDLQIAAIARAHGATLVTHNTAEFVRVPGLRLNDWEA